VKKRESRGKKKMFGRDRVADSPSPSAENISDHRDSPHVDNDMSDGLCIFSPLDCLYGNAY
jgi:hypothetical protein